MEVHHHSHTSRNKWTHYFWEFLMLFLAVSSGFYAENLREGILHKQEVRTHMRSLLSDLQSDIMLFDSVIDRISYSTIMADSLVEVLHADNINASAAYYTARSTTANLGYYYSNSKSFDQLKNAGLLRYVKSKELLEKIGTYYVSFEWLDNQTVMTRLKVDEIHKGNALLFDSYVFQQMMNVGLTTSNKGRQIINQPMGSPALLSDNIKDINRVSLNYHYYSTTAKFYKRTAVVQRERAIQLIKLINNEYHFD